MRISPRNSPVYSIYTRRNKINPVPTYQRGAVWSTQNKQLLIDSIFRGYDIPKIYLRRVNDPHVEHEVVDGQQRIRTLWEFQEDRFPIGNMTCDIPNIRDLTGLHYSDLTGDELEIINGFELTIMEISDSGEEEIRDLFLRLQEGKTLNPPEKRNAMPGNMRDFIRNLAEDNPVFPKTHIRSERYGWDDLAAHVTNLELNGGPTELKAENLRRMYENNQDFNQTGSVASKIKKVLNYMSRSLHPETPEMDIKWGFVDLYLLISLLMDDYDIQNCETDFGGVFANFERERRSVDDPSDLISGEFSLWNKDLYDYIQSFNREGAKRDNIEERHQVYKRRFLNDIPYLVPKDPNRGFTRDQKIIIWRRDEKTCQICGEIVDFSDMEADHITPHSSGGLTNIDNGQTLCQPCNRRKSSS